MRADRAGLGRLSCRISWEGAIPHGCGATAACFDKGTSGWERHETAASRNAERHIEKHLPSALAETDLAAWAADHQIDTLTVIGYITDNGVGRTIKHALHEDLAVQYLPDSSGSISCANRTGSAGAEEVHHAFSSVLQSRFAAVLATYFDKGHLFRQAKASPLPVQAGFISIT